MFNIDISDDIAKSFFDDALKLCESECIDTAEDFINKNRFSSNNLELIKTAFYYLAIAEWLKNNDKEKSGKYFHYAGNLMKIINYNNQAARAYANAGFVLTDFTKNKIDNKAYQLAIRSFAQSKNSFFEVGNSEDSEKMYIEEQKAKIRYLKTKGQFGFGLKLWRISSNFGTSFFRWICCFTLIIVIFLVTYEILHNFGYIINDKSEWKPIISSLYFTFVTISTLGYGDFIPTAWGAQIVVILNIIFGYLLLGLGIGIISRKIKGH